MGLYQVVKSGSGEVSNVIEWDGTSPFSAPNGYYLSEITGTVSPWTGSGMVNQSLYSGKFYGDVNADDIILNNDNETSILSLLGETEYGRLKINTYSTNVSESPDRNYFRVDTDLQTTSWQNTDIKKIVLSGHNLTSGDQKIYQNKLIEIIKDSLDGTEITLTQTEGGSYKTFTILSASYYEKRNLEGALWRNFEQAWGELNLSIREGLDYKYTTYDSIYNFLSSNSSNPNYPAKYFELYVTESASATGSKGQPLHSEQFFIDIKNQSNAKLRRYEFTTTTNFTIPKWAKKTTVICVGAGGGGGSGMVAWSDYWEPFYKHVTDNAEKIDCASLAIGGGGGAGGNVKFKTFNSTELPPGSKCSIQIGSGGLGGSFILDSMGGNPKKTALECAYFGGGCFDLWVGKDGNNGGDSVFGLPNGESVVGRGGLGGHRGLGIPSLYVQYFLQRIPALVPGGLNYLKKDADGVTTAGSTLSGGPGGFGISVIDPQLLTMHHNRIKNRTDNKRMREYPDIYENINSAPSLPYKNTVVLDYEIGPWDFPVSNPDNPDILMPYGYIYNPDPKITQGSKEAGMQYVNGSSDIPSFNAPTGGGGGTGDVSDGFAKFFHLDKNLSEKYTNRTITHAEIDNNTVNLYPYQKIGRGGKRLIRKNFYGIQFGEGGDGGNLVTLGGLSEVTASNGGFPGGGGGGGGSIVFPSENSTDTWHGVVNNSSQVTYNNVSNKMSGGYGANGMIVIIVEG